MKFLLLLFLCLGFWGKIQCQNQIKIREFYKGEGVILPNTSNIKIKDAISFYNPTIDEIKLAEQMLIEQYNAVLFSGICHNCKPIKNVKMHFRNYNRQYVGYLNNLGEKVIMINLLKNVGRKNEFYYPNWEKEFCVGFGDFYERNTRHFWVNLNSKTVTK